jgi:hypothetical protein
MARRVYFDTCVLDRPLDDQSQARIRLETEVTEHLLRAVCIGARTITRVIRHCLNSNSVLTSWPPWPWPRGASRP